MRLTYIAQFESFEAAQQHGQKRFLGQGYVFYVDSQFDLYSQLMVYTLRAYREESPHGHQPHQTED